MIKFPQQPYNFACYICGNGKKPLQTYVFLVKYFTTEYSTWKIQKRSKTTLMLTGTQNMVKKINIQQKQTPVVNIIYYCIYSVPYDRCLKMVNNAMTNIQYFKGLLVSTKNQRNCQ